MPSPPRWRPSCRAAKPNPALHPLPADLPAKERGGATVVDVNPEANPFGELAERLSHGRVVRAPAAHALPALVEEISRSPR